LKKLFWGFFFIYLNFNLNVNAHSLNVLPDFVGYILLLQGMKQLEEESHFFRSGRPFAVGMAVYTAILWVGALLGVTAGGWIGTILELIALAVSFYVSWLLIQGVLEMEKQQAADWGGAVLYSRWKLLLAVQVISSLLGLMANLANFSMLFSLAGVLVIVSIVLVILYLLAWNRTANTYESGAGQNAENPDIE